MSDTPTAPALLQPRFAAGAPMRMVGLRQRYVFAERMQVPDQWQRFLPLMDIVPGRLARDAFGVCWFRPDGFDYMTAVQVVPGSATPEGCADVTVPARRYAVFPHRDHVSLLPRTIDAIFQQWLPGSGERLGTAPEMTEVYDESFDPQRGRGGIELWISLHD